MRTILKHIVANTYKPLLVKYLSKTRWYRYNDIRLEIPPQVFHPGFFTSTRFLLRYLSKLPMTGKKMLELGAGSGLISVYAVQKEAHVTASDINPVAIDYLHKNSRENKVKMEILRSDLFAAIPPQHFDIIAINPPYYKQQPKTFSDHAWFCGERGEYFSGLFQQLPAYMHTTTETIMVLCEGCDIPMIEATASSEGFRLRLMQAKQHMLEKNFIYKIEKNQ